MVLAPSDVHRRESIRKRILKTCKNVLITALVITGISTIGLGVNQAIHNHDASNLNQPVHPQTVTADDIMQESSQKTYNWERKYHDADSKAESIDYNVAILKNGDLQVSQGMKVKLDERTGGDWFDDDDWSQVYQRIPISTKGYKSIKINKVGINDRPGIPQTSYVDPDSMSSSSWNTNQSYKWFLGKLNESESTIQGDFKAGDNGIAVLGVNIPKTIGATVDLQFDYTLTPGDAIKLHPDRTVTEVFNLADPTKSGGVPVQNVSVTINRPTDRSKQSAWIKLPESTDPSWKITPSQVTFQANEILMSELPSAVVSIPAGNLDLDSLNMPSDTNETPAEYAKSTLLGSNGTFTNDEAVSVGSRMSETEARKQAEAKTAENKKKADKDLADRKEAFKERQTFWKESEPVARYIAYGTLASLVLILVLSTSFTRGDRKRKLIEAAKEMAEDPNHGYDPFQRLVVSNMIRNGETEVTDLNIIDSTFNLLSAPIHRQPGFQYGEKHCGDDETWTVDQDMIYAPLTSLSLDDDKEVCFQQLIHVYPGPRIIYSGIDTKELERGLPPEQVRSLIQLAQQDGVDVDSTVTISIHPDGFHWNRPTLALKNKTPNASTQRHYYDLDFLTDILARWKESHGDMTFDLDEFLQFYQDHQTPGLAKKMDDIANQLNKEILHLDESESTRGYNTSKGAISYGVMLIGMMGLGFFTTMSAQGFVSGLGLLKDSFAIGALTASCVWLNRTLTMSPKASQTELAKIIDRQNGKSEEDGHSNHEYRDAIQTSRDDSTFAIRSDLSRDSIGETSYSYVRLGNYTKYVPLPSAVPTPEEG